MRFRVLGLSLLSITLICFLPFSALGQPKLNYFTVKGGIYSPTDDLDDFNFDSGFNGELSIGRHFNPNIALELNAGYFETDASFITSISGIGTVTEQDDVAVIPLTITGKAIGRIKYFDFYAEVGLGAYFADLESNLTGGGSAFTLDDDDTVFGGHVGLGVDFNVTPTVFIGIEGKFILQATLNLKAP